ncbi:hypothetical protein AFK68_22715 [Hydrocoleum sp. CS-953]|uniref:hypothetical protein n=1 Tax=Hydrocoleum sp. CS-953 TaxID=1671698 RepID=UPI000B9A9CE5|nr:hypothetical protein [Hydrocoleum sp. CS-953]OZH52683.1 hypothetical protein AFK68_22715 [Hydrocoleum sp. CS-953]
MRKGERPQLKFIISQFVPGWNPKSKKNLGRALDNEEVGNFFREVREVKDGKIRVGKSQHFWELHRMKIFLTLFGGKIPQYCDRSLVINFG